VKNGDNNREGAIIIPPSLLYTIDFVIVSDTLYYPKT
jgi:hypothetical protein